MEKGLAGWKRELLRAHGLIAELFARSEPRARSLAYLQGLLAAVSARTAGSWPSGWAKRRLMRSSIFWTERAGMQKRRATGYAVMEWKNCTVGRRYSSSMRRVF